MAILAAVEEDTAVGAIQTAAIVAVQIAAEVDQTVAVGAAAEVIQTAVVVASAAVAPLLLWEEMLCYTSIGLHQAKQ